MFLNSFPKVRYDITRNRYSNFETVTNITFRFSIIRSVLDNIGSYYKYEIRDGDRPEILAEKIYGDPEAYWIILYANDMYDPQYDWPLDYDGFKKYIIGKYGSLSTAKTTYHHYDKVTQRTESLSGLMTEKRVQINAANLTSNLASSLANTPYDTYATLADEQDVSTFNYNGQTVTEVIFRDRITNYDYEDALNESKRNIKIIKANYYNQIVAEFEQLTNNATNPRLRRLF